MVTKWPSSEIKKPEPEPVKILLSKTFTIFFLLSSIIVFALTGALSLYPTTTYILWAIPLSKGKLPNVTANLVARLRLIINIELFGFSLIPLFATLMARGIGG